jgi:hypothetical protein
MESLFCGVTSGKFEKRACDFAETGIPHAFQNGSINRRSVDGIFGRYSRVILLSPDPTSIPRSREKVLHK